MGLGPLVTTATVHTSQWLLEASPDVAHTRLFQLPRPAPCTRAGFWDRHVGWFRPTRLPCSGPLTVSTPRGTEELGRGEGNMSERACQGNERGDH